MSQLLIDRVMLFGTELEQQKYLELCKYTDLDRFYGSLSKVMLLKTSNFHPMKSKRYLQAYSSNWKTRHKTTEWWQWLEDFRPKSGFASRRFLIDPMGHIFDCRKKCFLTTRLDPDKREGHRYLEYHIDRVEKYKGYIVDPDIVTRGRLIAYRYPHLAWRDYLFHRYHHTSVILPESIRLNILGLAVSGATRQLVQVYTGFYSQNWNHVTGRGNTGRVRKNNTWGPARTVWLRPLEVDHKDRNRLNDLPCNIRWVDRGMNLSNTSSTFGKKITSCKPNTSTQP
ncbi:hypothetical protein [Escherichia coli]|uniref:hypothetical protein n=1 Tax=Escherichia coli TaxID=562 RepID=UPI0007E4E82F|nr:hypothetical protein [Escherichia coli]